MMETKIEVTFTARLEIIIGNPFVYIPPSILNKIFEQAHKDRGAIPVRGTINGKAYQQTLVKYSKAWRLYVNMKMLKNSPKRIGEILAISIEFDPSDRTIEPHPKWVKALKANQKANEVFEGLSPPRQKEIIRYISNLKSEESINRNVVKAVEFLQGKGRL